MGKIKLIYGTIPYLYTTTPQLIYGSIPFVTAPLKQAPVAIEEPPTPNNINNITGIPEANISARSNILVAQIASISGISWG